ncbi:hypothetical protein POPTR_002G169550v4 [Populus trichocarpa]|uniref:Uncharacterized protein n=1 Tax=Populus trichocarpa TaxID=3694 RepID=A0ACC0TEC1_POPTR|nr:hypothetical protein BDE02_02G156300 [Populus trichocarpa]KAI9399944.1 hypothetical protein POPTR_002G169550v4 [Populus trichocarpa]
MVAMGEWVFFRREAGGEKFQGEGHCCHNKMRLLSAELIEKLPLEPNVGLHEAPSAGNLHIASPAWWNGRHVHLLAAAYVQSTSSGFYTERPIFPVILPRFFPSG